MKRPNPEVRDASETEDDDGNPLNNGVFMKNRDNGRKPSVEYQNIIKRKQQSQNEVNVLRMIGVIKCREKKLLSNQIKPQTTLDRSNPDMINPILRTELLVLLSLRGMDEKR